MSTVQICLLAWTLVSLGTYACLKLRDRCETQFQTIAVSCLIWAIVVLPIFYFTHYAHIAHPLIVSFGCFIMYLVTGLAAQTNDSWQEFREQLAARGIDPDRTWFEYQRRKGPAYLFADVTRRKVLFPWTRT